ncbi:MAG: methylmalonyl Co-A mutase-associated GTPase MeaB [Deltaproteobacteria bacterium]|nr:methylmalonyl Co-A mutase-associated GTPase MeaB [Deltaproteobacteria bacterium]
MSEGAESPSELAARVKAGDRGAVARALNLVDDRRSARRADALVLLDALEGQGRGRRIGLTGAPGAGKSTLLDALATGLRARGRTVGILAVDPSSRKSGGALLGDRFRMGASARDAGVFFRSLAARDQLGGLAEVAGASVEVLAAAFDVVFVETVGVGQSEASVADFVDTLVFVAQPAAGDLLQFMKAGILEWPDVFFVNKSDLEGLATRTATELRAGLDLGRGEDPADRPPVLSGSARDGVGIDALIDALDAHHAKQDRTGEFRRRREAGRLARIESALVRRYGRFGLARLGGRPALEAFVAAHPARSAEGVIDALGARFEAGFAAKSEP